MRQSSLIFLQENIMIKEKRFKVVAQLVAKENNLKIPDGLFDDDVAKENAKP